MASEAAKAVAKEVLETISKGKLPSVSKIAPKYGYSKKTAASGLIQKTKTYKEIVGNALDSFMEERQAIFDEMKKKRAKAPYSSLVGGLEVSSKNIQLLTGGKTENVGIDEDRKVIRTIMQEIRHE